MNKQLHQKLRSENFTEAISFIEVSSSLDLNSKDEKGNTALHLVCGIKYRDRMAEELIKLLLYKKADPNITNTSGDSCLMIALYSGGIMEYVTILVNGGSDVLQENSQQQNCIALAVIWDSCSQVVNLKKLLSSKSTENTIRTSTKSKSARDIVQDWHIATDSVVLSEQCGGSRETFQQLKADNPDWLTEDGYFRAFDP